MTTPDIETCSVVTGFSCDKCGYVGRQWQHSDCDYLPLEQRCGEPVAELPTCRECGWRKNAHNAIEDHEYRPRLVHVTPSCEECGHTQTSHRPEGFFDQVTEPEHRPSLPVCEDCEVERKSKDDASHLHPYAPTVTEKPSEHEAEASDG